MKGFVITVLAGAIVAQIWGTISWMALPWHNMNYKSFKDDTAISQVFQDNQTGSGIYMLPNFDESVHESEEGMKAWQDKAADGPFAFIVAKPNGISPGMGKAMGGGFLLNILISAMLLWMLKQSSLTCFRGRTAFMAVGGGLGGLYPHVANYLWWHFPPMYTFAGAADLFVTWGLAGAVMVKLKDKFSS